MKKILVALIALFACALSATAGIRVMSYNIRYGAAKDGSNAWEVRKDATSAMLKDLRPAVFGVQEALDYQIQYILESCPEYAGTGGRVPYSTNGAVKYMSDIGLEWLYGLKDDSGVYLYRPDNYR